MSLWSKVRGTIETIFQIGLGGPQIKNNAGAVDIRNAGDTAFAVVRGASPVGNSDLTTKQYVDTLATRTIVSAQFSGGSALPSNTGTEKFSVVTTSGVNASIGQLIWDDGTGIGTATVLAAASRVIITTQAFTGGTISFAADSEFFWDTGSSAWVNIGGTAVSGSRRIVRYAITNAASQDSATLLPANAFVRQATLEVATPYSGGTTLSIGQAGSLTLFQLTTDNLPTVAGSYESTQDTSAGVTPLAIRTTITGSPAAGAGFVLVEYTVPDA